MPSLQELFGEAPIFPAQCPTRELLAHVTSRWGVLVLQVLREESPLRWGEIRRRVDGVSEKMLAQTLRTLEDDDLLTRTVFPVVPPHVEYALTPAGREVAELMEPLLVWIAHRAMS